MTDIKLHQTKTGPNTGKWVTCPATKTCRNKTTHYDQADLNNTAEYLTQKTGVAVKPNEVPEQAIIDYLKLSKENEEKYYYELETVVPYSGIIYPEDAERLNKIFTTVEREILENPLPTSLVLSEEIRTQIRHDLFQIRGLNRSQRFLIIDMLNDASASYYNEVWAKNHHDQNLPNANKPQMERGHSVKNWLAELRILSTKVR
jgi:hypothetical protein